MEDVTVFTQILTVVLLIIAKLGCDGAEMLLREVGRFGLVVAYVCGIFVLAQFIEALIAKASNDANIEKSRIIDFILSFYC